MNILIFGACGFIGSSLCEYFANDGTSVFGVDIINQSGPTNYRCIKVDESSVGLESLFSGDRIDICINAAGSGNVSSSLDKPLQDFKANVFDEIKILDTIRRTNSTCKYIHISSAAIYGNPQKLPVSESDLMQPISSYGFHKQISETVCREYHQLFGIPIAILRPFSVYGPGLKKQLFWDLCTKIYKAKELNISVFGTGSESRDFIYIADLVKVFRLIIEKSDFNCSIYNVASGRETAIKQVTDIISQIEPKVHFSFSGESRPGDPKNWQADISKIKNLGFNPSLPIEQGIKNYLQWYKQNHLHEQ